MTPADFAEVFGTRNVPAVALPYANRDGKLKQPFAIARADDALSAFGGIWPGAAGPVWSERQKKADIR